MSTYLIVERLLDDGRVPLRGEHGDRKADGEERQDRVERLHVRQVLDGAALRLPRGAEAERDDADGAPDEERGDAGEADEPGEDDTFAPDRRQERDERYREGEARSVHSASERTREERRKRGGNVHERRDGDATSVDPSEDAGRLAVAREGKQHARARVEARVRRGEHRGEQHCIHDVYGGSEPRAHEHDRERRRSHARI